MPNACTFRRAPYAMHLPQCDASCSLRADAQHSTQYMPRIGTPECVRRNTSLRTCITHAGDDGDDWADDLAAMLEARGDELRTGVGAKQGPAWEPRA